MKKLTIYASDKDEKIDAPTLCYYYRLENGTLVGSNLECLNNHKVLNETALKLRHSYSSFIFELNQYFYQQKWVFKNTISNFFISQLSNKRTEISKTYDAVCHLHLLRDLITSYQFDEIELCGTNAGLYGNLVQSAIHGTKCKIPLEAERKAKQYFLKQLFFISKFIFLIVIARWARKKTYQASPRVFLSRYPLHFDNSFHEDKYGKLINPHDGILISLATDGFHQNLSIRAYRHHLGRLNASALNFFLLDRYVPLGAILRYPLECWRAWRIFRAFGQRRSLFAKLDISAFLRQELYQSCLQIPRLHLYYEAIVRFFQEFHTAEFIYYLHEYVYGRYFTIILKQKFPGVHTIGFQHGPASKRRLVYYLARDEAWSVGKNHLLHLAIPDEVWAENDQSKHVYEDAGYKNIIVMKNVPRLSYLSGLSKAKQLTNRVLVACGLHDGQLLCNYVRDRIKKDQSTQYLFKLHPRCQENERIEKDLKKNNFKNIELVGGEIEKFLTQIDYVICTYSSVGIEAHYLHIPVKIVNLDFIINESPLYDLQSDSGWVHS